MGVRPEIYALIAEGTAAAPAADGSLVRRLTDALSVCVADLERAPSPEWVAQARRLLEALPARYVPADRPPGPGCPPVP